jgi:hypothetical protein
MPPATTSPHHVTAIAGDDPPGTDITTVPWTGRFRDPVGRFEEADREPIERRLPPVGSPAFSGED